MSLAMSFVLILALLAAGPTRTVEPTVHLASPGASPMTVEVSLSPLTERKVVLRVSGLRQYVSDDVSITVLEVERKRGGKGTGGLIEIRGALSVRPSYDRDVDLSFVVKHGDRVVRRQERRRLDAEEGKVLEFTERLELPSASPDISGLTLWITMTVREGEGV